MAHIVEMKITAEDFRQNYTPTLADSGKERHWMLDFAPGRDLLKTTLVKADPKRASLLFGQGDDIDEELDQVIDRLGLRDVAKPVGVLQELKITVEFFCLMLRCQFGRSRNADR